MLFAAPSAPACILWIDRLPVSADYLPPVCPQGTMLDWSSYNLRLIGGDGMVLCEWPAAQSLTAVPCQPSPARNYHIEVWLNSNVSVCNVTSPDSTLTDLQVSIQCPQWIDEYRAGLLEVRGPSPIGETPPVQERTGCTLPRVDNSVPLHTEKDYQFLASRLSWWGISISTDEWQDRFDDQILTASNAAGVPAQILKSMIAQESQFWPLWTGTTGEVGWMQVTWDGADTALRHDPELFAHYCPLAIYDCNKPYDLLADWQQSAVRYALIADLTVTGTPMQASAEAGADLWTYAHILRAYACQAEELYPGKNVWQAAVVLYNAGTKCYQGEVVCPQGQKYLNEVLHDFNNSLNPAGNNYGNKRNLSE